MVANWAHAVALAVVLAVLTPAQEVKLRGATAGERDALLQTMNSLIGAVNSRNIDAFQSLVHERFFAFGEGWEFNRSGYLRGARRIAEPGSQIAALIRSIRMIGDNASSCYGFFRTSGLKIDFAGEFNAEMVRQEGKWVAHAIHFTPYFFEAPYAFRIEQSASHGRPGPDGWITLFDGKSLDAFVAVDGGKISPVWGIEDSALRLKALPPGQRLPGGPQGIRTRDSFASFELEFEWKLGPKGNSGVKYGLMYLNMSDGAGFEYQIADDKGDPGATIDPRQRSGSMYQQQAPARDAVAPLGEYNRSRIVVRGNLCEHWLNGQKVVSVQLPYAVPESPLLLQNHTTDAWFRNLRIRRLEDR